MIETAEIKKLINQLNDDIAMKVEPEVGFELSGMFFLSYATDGDLDFIEWHGLTLWASESEDMTHQVSTIEELEAVVRFEFNKIMNMFRKVRI